jgi:hypothetical protein
MTNACQIDVIWNLEKIMELYKGTAYDVPQTVKLSDIGDYYVITDIYNSN